MNFLEILHIILILLGLVAGGFLLGFGVASLVEDKKRNDSK